MNSNNAASSPAPAPLTPTADGAAQPLPSPGSTPTAVAPSSRHRLLHWAILSVLAAGLLIGVIVAIPIVKTAVNTISTDDAYVNGHVTFVAPRVSGQVKSVLTDDNKRVKAGQKIVELDPVPYQAIVNIKQANVDSAQADLDATESQVRALFALLRSQRWKLQASIESVNNQAALLSA